jgi:transposase
MYRVHLTEAQQAELQRRTHQPGVMPRTRDRLEMVRLADAGFSIPHIARLLRISEKRIRHYIKAFLADGFDALPDRPHPGQPSALTKAMEEAIRQEVRKEETTWSASQLADWLDQQFGVRLGPDWLTKRLKQAGIVYKRTSRSLKHKQNPEAVAAKKQEMGAQEKRGIKTRST